MHYFVDLIMNLTLLVALSVISGFIEKHWARHTRLCKIAQGLLFGFAGVIGMLKPLNLGPGLIFDGRSIMVSLCAFFFGPGAAAIAGTMTILCRILLGGVGTFTGLLVIIFSALIGLAAHFRFKPDINPPSTKHLFLFGLLVHLAMLSLMFTLPEGAGVTVVMRIGLPLLLLYPLATILVGKILADQVLADRTISDLEKAKENLAITLKSIGDAVISMNLKGEIVFMNHVAEELTGWSQTEACGRPQEEVFRIVSEETREKLDGFVDRVIQENLVMALPNHTILLSKDGTERFISDSAAPIHNARGEITGVVLVFRDLSDQRRLEDQFRQAQKMESVGLLAGGVAHDFNNMLGVIIGHTELVLDSVKHSEPLYENLQEILKAANRSTQVTRQLLAFARKQIIAPKVLDLNEIIEGMLKMLRRLLGENIDVAWMPKAQLWPIRIDPSQIDQILANLCVNARDAINGVGRITIETDMVTFDQTYCYDHAGFSPGDFVMLTVSDDGCGMDKKIQDRIFEPFFTTKEVNQGTGLGMSTVYGIVKQNNGFINVYSEPGKGTTLKIYLPRHLGVAVDPLPEKTLKIKSGNGETILVVEDENAILTMVEAMLNRSGYDVLTADRIDEAMRLAEVNSGKISLLITDVVMPEMDGRELAERLMVLNPGLKLMFMSGYTKEVITNRGVLDEGVCFIQKPFSMNDLISKVQEALEQ